jgi:hypothetical protein
MTPTPGYSDFLSPRGTDPCALLARSHSDLRKNPEDRYSNQMFFQEIFSIQKYDRELDCSKKAKNHAIYYHLRFPKPLPSIISITIVFEII